MDAAAMGATGELKAVDDDLDKLKDWGDRRWFVNSQGQMLALIDGPVEFQMGSPLNESDRSLDDQTLHRQTIPRRLFIAAKEVTVEQFQQFVQADPKHEQYGTPPKPFGSIQQSQARWSDDRRFLVCCRCLLQLAEPQGEPARVLRAERRGQVCRWNEDPGRCLAADGLSVAYRS